MNRDKYGENRIETIPLEQNVLSEMFSVVFFALCGHEIPVPNDLEMPAGFDPSLNAVLTCSCLVFARKHHIVTEEHFTPLLLACFSCAIGRMPPPTSSRPGPKGVTIAAQFMTVLQLAIWLASIVGLQKVLPLPSTIFQPFAYIPFHDTAFKITQKYKFHGQKAQALKQY